MTSHDKVARAFVAGERATGSRMYTDGDTIYSYGSHWPIATWMDSGTILFNVDVTSSSTSKHTNYVRRKIPSHIDIIECETKEIRKYLLNPSAPLILYKDKKITSLGESVRIICDMLKDKGMKRIPFKKIHDSLWQTINKLVKKDKYKPQDLYFERWYDEFNQIHVNMCYMGNKLYFEDYLRQFDDFKEHCIKSVEEEIAKEV